ncbi:short-subunit dehydrogenase [Hasllibacter halocynthiae]|uniref:Short-subunit dehydrogenase n=1 Tax=Hasllibacter halocynthiae TaxID=595589 RepID=A0A2T0X9X6_9RHOB|nr:SDR family NAD(P)-dependent oxidoreductase [Hasllibacter halocynthiae]PRY95748.1 short-subunit dehydrogenase [Hasllibacter halocynthiae]
MKQLSHKVFVLTGASSGIGRALAVALADEGVRLALVDRDADGLEKTRRMLGNADVLAAAFSVADRLAWDDFRGEVLERFGTVDAVVNNAGIAHEAVTVQHMRAVDMERVMDVNFMGVFHGTQTFLSDLIARPEATVVNTSSTFGLTAVGLQGAYCASKFAVRGFSEALRMEARAYYPGLTVSTVFPGGIATAISDNAIAAGSRTAEEREADKANFAKNLVISPERAAEVVVAGIRAKRERILIGRDASVMDWMSRMLPARYTRVMLGQLKKSGLVPDIPALPVDRRAGG